MNTRTYVIGLYAVLCLCQLYLWADAEQNIQDVLIRQGVLRKTENHVEEEGDTRSTVQIQQSFVAPPDDCKAVRIAGVSDALHVLNGLYMTMSTYSCEGRPAFGQTAVIHPNYLYYHQADDYTGWVIGISVCGTYIEARSISDVATPDLTTDWEEIPRQVDGWVDNPQMTVTCNQPCGNVEVTGASVQTIVNRVFHYDYHPTCAANGRPMYQAETEEGTLYLYYNFDPSNSNNNLWIMGDVRCSPYAYALATDNAFTPDLIRPITWYEYDHVTTETFIYGVNMTSTCRGDLPFPAEPAPSVCLAQCGTITVAGMITQTFLDGRYDIIDGTYCDERAVYSLEIETVGLVYLYYHAYSQAWLFASTLYGPSAYAAGLGDACAVQDIGSTWMEYNPDVGGFVDNTNLMMECYPSMTQNPDQVTDDGDPNFDSSAGMPFVNQMLMGMVFLLLTLHG